MPYLSRTDKTPPPKGPGSKLTPKMALFVSEYLVDFSGTHAVKRAGYKTTNPTKLSNELLRHPLVKREIEKFKQERFEKNELSAEYVIQKLISIVENTDKENPQAALRGLELLGKHLGMYRDRQEISGPDGESIKHEQRITEDSRDFTSRLSRLAERAGEVRVVSLPLKTGTGEA